MSSSSITSVNRWGLYPCWLQHSRLHRFRPRIILYVAGSVVSLWLSSLCSLCRSTLFYTVIFNTVVFVSWVAVLIVPVVFIDEDFIAAVFVVVVLYICGLVAVFLVWQWSVCCCHLPHCGLGVGMVFETLLSTTLWSLSRWGLHRCGFRHCCPFNSVDSLLYFLFQCDICRIVFSVVSLIVDIFTESLRAICLCYQRFYCLHLWGSISVVFGI